MILPIIIHVQFHEIMDKRPSVKIPSVLFEIVSLLPQTIFVQDIEIRLNFYI